MYVSLCYVSKRMILSSYHDSPSEALAAARDMVKFSISQWPMAYVTDVYNGVDGANVLDVSGQIARQSTL